MIMAQYHLNSEFLKWMQEKLKLKKKIRLFEIILSFLAEHKKYETRNQLQKNKNIWKTKTYKWAYVIYNQWLTKK